MLALHENAGDEKIGMSDYRFKLGMYLPVADAPSSPAIKTVPVGSGSPHPVHTRSL